MSLRHTWVVLVAIVLVLAVASAVLLSNVLRFEGALQAGAVEIAKHNDPPVLGNNATMTYRFSARNLLNVTQDIRWVFVFFLTHVEPSFDAFQAVSITLTLRHSNTTQELVLSDAGLVWDPDDAGPAPREPWPFGWEGNATDRLLPNETRAYEIDILFVFVGNGGWVLDVSAREL